MSDNEMSDLIAKWEARASHYKDNVEHARSYDTAVRSAKFQKLVEEFVADLRTWGVPSFDNTRLEP
jgi:hypothetical protein